MLWSLDIGHLNFFLQAAFDSFKVFLTVFMTLLIWQDEAESVGVDGIVGVVDLRVGNKDPVQVS